MLRKCGAWRRRTVGGRRRVRAYSLRRPLRRAASQPSWASRATEVRTSRSGSPNGAASSMRLAEGDTAAAGRDRIPQERHKQRAAAQRPLAQQAPAQSAQAGVDRVGHVRLPQVRRSHKL